MNIIFANKDGSLAYKLCKQDPGFELMKWDAGGKPIERGRYQGGTTKAGWKKMASGNGIYPSSIRGAIDIIAEDQLLCQEGDVDLKTARALVTGFIHDLDHYAETVSE